MRTTRRAGARALAAGVALAAAVALGPVGPAGAEPDVPGGAGPIGVDPIGAWAFDSVDGSASPDSSGLAGPATLGGGAILVDSGSTAHGTALGLDGATAQATAPVPALDTTSSYTVSARVRMDALPSGYVTAVAADGRDGRSPFFLQYSGSANGQTGFAMSFPGGPRAIATGVTVAPGRWYQLTGVRDAARGTLALYVDGRLEATAAGGTGVETTGTLSVGRAQWDGRAVDFLDGAVDDVRVDDRALSAAQVASLAGAPADDGRVAAWTGSAQHLGGPYTDKTVRDVVHTSVGGSGVQLRLSNAHGTVPVTFDAVYVGARASRADVVPGTNRRAMFGGRGAVTVPVGGSVTSDAVPMSVGKGDDLAVSVHVAGATGEVTGHSDARATTYYGDGDLAALDSGARYVDTITSWFWLDAVTVLPDAPASTVVALGDSITDGYLSTVDANHRWPNYLADRLGERPAFSVVDAGISGNMVVADGAGVSALTRLDRDVLTQPGVSSVVVLEGINDIGNAVVTDPQQMIDAYRQIIARAHTAGATVVGATILPFEGAGYYSAAKERVRDAVNDWIRTSGAFDSVVDLDSVMSDPADPDRMLPAYDSGDHLHPDDAGYEAMADAVPLGLRLEVTAQARCVGSQPYVAVRAQNAGADAVGVRLTTPYGEKEVAQVASGRSAAQSFKVRDATPGGATSAGTVYVTGTQPGGASATVAEPYAAVSCG
ncbi:GDSL-type esterase/lipase family protein [Cellulomonas sp. PhB143]|uniref:GDSL-type esterase/lipase family protein n=1 Tax=Cellulomonas sp. PhB143 TaxID=2485186 RepID=UPI0013158C23|nr:GDSL-type esterase/lipase family protein [Cellulomonas sp. PhB143]